MSAVFFFTRSLSMGRTDVIEAIEQNIEQLAGADVRQEVMAGREKITDSTKPEKVARWMKGVMERLDAHVDETTRSQIMLNCGYNCILHNNGVVKKAKARRAKFDSLDSFLEAEQQNPPAGTRLAREGGMLYQFYTPSSYTHPLRCYCSLVNKLPPDENLSATYCQCSRGLVEKYWEAILERPVQVELVDSCISGAAECQFAIHLQD
jgi:hypothetical protein